MLNPEQTMHSEKPDDNKNHKSLAIALVAALALLLAAVGIATWLFLQKSGGGSIITTIDPNSTKNVKSLSWVEPTMPSGYQKYDQSTNQAQATYYADPANGCSVTTRVMPVADGADLAATAAKANDSLGIETTTLADSMQLTINDADGQRQYGFDGTEYDQKVTVPTLDYDGQSGVIYFKQFGSNLASVGFVCRAATLGVNVEDLAALMGKFTVKTER